jgi:hypothetical protein
MCIQLDLEVRCKTPKKKRIPSNFHEFWSKEVHSKEHPKKIKLWHLNVIISYISWNEELQFFEVDLQQGNFKILGYFLKFSYFYFLRNWFFQLCLKTTKFGKKPPWILGVNKYSLIYTYWTLLAWEVICTTLRRAC